MYITATKIKGYMKEFGNDTDREKRKYSNRNLFYYHAAKHKAHMQWKAGDQPHVLWHDPM